MTTERDDQSKQDPQKPGPESTLFKILKAIIIFLLVTFVIAVLFFGTCTLLVGGLR